MGQMTVAICRFGSKADITRHLANVCQKATELRAAGLGAAAAMAQATRSDIS
jgi:hypothetical protein